MKIIISENQFNNLIPRQIKRRFNEEELNFLTEACIDFVNFRRSFEKNYPSLDDFLNDTINIFLVDYMWEKANENETMSDNEIFYMVWDDMEPIYKLLIPYLKMKWKQSEGL